MNNGGERRMSVVFLLAGAVTIAVTFFLFQQLRQPDLRSETFEFTKWFILTQEAVLFGALAFVAAQAGISRTPVPVRGSYITIIVLYNSAAVATVLLFNVVTLPSGLTSANTYYTICIAESGLAVAALVLMQVVGIAARSGHSDAQASRRNADDLIQSCERVLSVVESNGVARELAASLRELPRQLRFSEAIRRDPLLASDVDMRLAHLEQLASEGMDDESSVKAAALVREIKALARRRG